jgi:hypothetical protein
MDVTVNTLPPLGGETVVADLAERLRPVPGRTMHRTTLVSDELIQ